MTKSTEYPACRYCSSQTHTSQEFELCAKSYNEFFKKLAVKKLGDCSLSEVLLRLQALCPHGFNFSRSHSDHVNSGADVDIVIHGKVDNALRANRFVSFFLEGVLKGVDLAKAPHVINPTGGFKDEEK